MKKTISRILLVTCLVASGGAAFAGYTVSSPVRIYLDTRAASGSFGTARNSPDQGQLIYCQVTSYDFGTSGYCYAADENGTSLACAFWDQPQHERVLESIADSSVVSFSVAEDGTCATISVAHSSMYEPKQ